MLNKLITKAKQFKNNGLEINKDTKLEDFFIDCYDRDDFIICLEDDYKVDLFDDLSYKVVTFGEVEMKITDQLKQNV